MSEVRGKKQKQHCVQRVMPRGRMTSSPERNIRESSVRFFNAHGEAIRALVFNIPIPYHQCQRELCQWALPDSLT